MPVKKICPLFLIFYKTENNTCIEELCSFWSESGLRCTFVSGLSRLSNISDSLRTLIDIVSTRLPDKS